MTRVVRYRQKSLTLGGSTTIYNNPDFTGFSSTQNVTVSRLRTCSDWVGAPIVPSGFNSDQRWGAVFWTGKCKNSVSSRSFNKLPIATGSGGLTEIDVAPLAPPNGWYLTVIAKTNPSRGELYATELVQDLIEIPRQLRDLWKVFTHPKTLFTPKGVANNYLGVKFGWLPLIDDVHKLLDLQTLVTKRAQELAQLHSGRGLRRRVKLGSDTKAGAFHTDFALNGVSTGVSLFHDMFCQKKSWGTIRWYPTQPPPYHPQDARMINDIRRQVLGLTPEGLAYGLWKVIPWTWLIGWFTNIGDYLLAFSNTVPAEHSKACFMSESIVIVSGTEAKPLGNAQIIKIDPSGTALRTIKTRTVSSYVLPGVNMPFLGVSQLSVLAALGTQRLRVIP